MALSPLVNVPVAWENALVDLQPTRQYGADHDTAMINTTMQLQAPAEEELSFFLPAVDAPEQEPVMRVVADVPGSVVEFQPSDFEEVDGELGEALKKAEAAQRELWEAVRAAAGGVHAAHVKVKKGEQLIRFYYPQRVPRLDDGSFEFKILAPLASFVLNPSGGELTLAVALPRILGRGITVSDAHFENPPGTNTGPMEPHTLAQREFRAHFFKLDPLYVVRYVYA